MRHESDIHSNPGYEPLVAFTSNLFKQASLSLPNSVASILEDGEKHNLSILIGELPDPDQQLYLQLGKNLKFDPFPKLPIELRVKIWRYGFPRPRHVCLETGYGIDINIFRGCSSSSTKKVRNYHNFITRPLPITLKINKESRLETLRHYTVLFQGDVDGLKANLPNVYARPFCFDLARDSLFMGFTEHISLPAGSEWIGKWLEYLDPKLPGELAKIRPLEIPDRRFAHIAFDNHTLDMADLWGGARIHSERGVLKCFMLGNLDVGELVKLQVEELYQQYQLQVPGCLSPKINVRNRVVRKSYWALG
ncbi:hypothetical protein BDZ45DRAFT_798630 [Acephala macrosclerotiorum]|nr:hypothetical protein BDZ45DRAFT_798630 [Acephala macrosclerotiorum]